jgi:hypothetical protein
MNNQPAGGVEAANAYHEPHVAGVVNSVPLVIMLLLMVLVVQFRYSACIASMFVWSNRCHQPGAGVTSDAASPVSPTAVARTTSLLAVLKQHMVTHVALQA